MSFSVQHVRYTFECDVCGLVERHDQAEDFDVEQHRRLVWQTVNVSAWQYLCCPACLETIQAIVLARSRAEAKANADKIAACNHSYAPRGLLQQCTQCKVFR